MFQGVDGSSWSNKRMEHKTKDMRRQRMHKLCRRAPSSLQGTDDGWKWPEYSGAGQRTGLEIWNDRYEGVCRKKHGEVHWGNIEGLSKSLICIEEMQKEEPEIKNMVQKENESRHYEIWGLWTLKF